MVSRIKQSKDSGFTFNKKVLTIFVIAVLLTAAVLLCVVVLKNKEETKYGNLNDAQSSIVYKEGLTFAPTKEDENNKKDNNETQIIPNNSGSREETLATNIPTTSVNALADPSGWTVGQIVSKAKDAVNKTKGYAGNLTVAHSESFSANVTECSAGGIVRSVVDLMIGWVVKPVNETLVYQNGKAVNSEGETVPIILPKKNAFALTENGVESATIQRAGNEYVIKINLVEEDVGMYDVPKHNAASIGYLDVASFDLSFMEVDSAYIVYKGSSLELRINAEGYVTYANYKIPLHIDGSAHKGSISGSATFEGEQTEEWRLDW